MILSNYHTHSTYCDGSAGLSEMARTAFGQGYSVLGFSAHAPLPFDSGWNMDEEDMAAYSAEVRALSEAYRGRMEILLGYEMDWIEGLRGPGSDFWSGVDRDFSIGSIHFLRAPDGNLFTVDDKAPVLSSVLEGPYSGNARRMVEDYWKALGSMISEGGFDILGHFDLIKKNAAPCGLFDGSEKWYRAAAMECLEAARLAGPVVEVNSGGIARGSIGECYPAPWILKEMRSRGMRITVDSDAHSGEHLAYARYGYQALKDAGFRECWYLSGGDWKATGLD